MWEGGWEGGWIDALTYGWKYGREDTSSLLSDEPDKKGLAGRAQDGSQKRSMALLELQLVLCS